MNVRFVWDAAEGELVAPALRILLRAQTEWSEFVLAHFGLPDLYASGMRYQRENYGSIYPEDWRDPPAMLRAGGGDCEDLATYRVADLHRSGETRSRAVYLERPQPSGQGRLFHIIVERADGTLEDPSRMLGMTRI